MQSQVIVQAREGRKAQERGEGETVCTATVAEERELSKVGQVAAAAIGSVDNGHCETAASHRDDQEIVKPQELIPECSEGREDVQPIPVNI